MSRDYFEATLRGGNGGYSVRDTVAVNFNAPRLNRYLILIHGFSMHEELALAKLRAFTAGLSERAPALQGQACHFTWPGDYGDPINRLLYARSVRSAKLCAPKFADYLESLRTSSGTAPNIVLIAHSLGCRLALEALELSSASVRKNAIVILMAAAYPSQQVVGSVLSAVRATSRTAAFFSNTDEALGALFVLGEWLAGYRARTIPEAIGMHGQPRSAWHVPIDVSGLRHNDYWDKDNVKEHICEVLGVAVVRSMPQYRALERQLAHRTLWERAINWWPGTW